MREHFDVDSQCARDATRLQETGRPRFLNSDIKNHLCPNPPQPAVIATSVDFDQDGALSRDFLLRRGRCCEEGCRNCPYGFGAANKRPAIPPSVS
ncbi:MAG: DUF5522 domain-containing protein [Chthoniobacterales bacterium]